MSESGPMAAPTDAGPGAPRALRPRPRLFIALLGLFALWIAFLVILSRTS